MQIFMVSFSVAKWLLSFVYLPAVLHIFKLHFPATVIGMHRRVTAMFEPISFENHLSSPYAQSLMEKVPCRLYKNGSILRK